MKKDNKKKQKGKYIIKENTAIVSKNKKSSPLLIILAFCVPVLLYLQTVSFGFTHLDDDSIIDNNIKFLSDFSNVNKAFLTDAFIIKYSPFYRPLQTMSYMVDIKISGGNNTWMFHLTNILLLGFISCSLFFLLKRFLIPPMLALISTLIYCAHPLFVSTIAYIPTRGELLLTLFSLLSFFFFIELLQKRKFIYLFLNWAAFTLALFCKETAALLPLLFLIYHFTFYNKKPIEKRYLIIIALYAVSGMLWYWLRSKAIVAISTSNGAIGLMPILTNLRTIPECLEKFFLLFGIAPIPGFSLLKTLIGSIIIVLIIIMFFKNKQRTNKEKLFCILWFLLMMFPPMLYRHPLIEYLDHRFFFPLIGILLFLLFLIPKKWFAKESLNKMYLLPLALFLLLSSFTFIKSRSYTDPTTFYNSAVSQNTNSAIAYNNRGILRTTKNDFQGAINDYNKAIAIKPTYDQAYFNRGYVKMYNMKDNAGAIEDFNIAISIKNDYANCYYHRGVANINLGKNKEAIYDLNIFISYTPNFAEAYNYKGMALGSTGNLKEAIINFNKAIELNPDFWGAYGNNAIAKYSLKDFQGAIDDCNKVLKLNPKDEKAQNLKIIALQELQKGK